MVGVQTRLELQVSDELGVLVVGDVDYSVPGDTEKNVCQKAGGKGVIGENGQTQEERRRNSGWSSWGLGGRGSYSSAQLNK